MPDSNPSGARLWTFCTSLYSRPGVADECLLLQMRYGVNVNLLLLSVFAGAEFGERWWPEHVAEADRVVGLWHTRVVAALRDLRQLLKFPGEISDWPEAGLAEVLRTKVKDAELESERVEVAMLADWFAARFSAGPRGEPSATIAHNVQGVLAYYGAGLLPELTRHLLNEARSNLPLT